MEIFFAGDWFCHIFYHVSCRIDFLLNVVYLVQKLQRLQVVTFYQKEYNFPSVRVAKWCLVSFTSQELGLFLARLLYCNAYPTSGFLLVLTCSHLRTLNVHGPSRFCFIKMQIPVLCPIVFSVGNLAFCLSFSAQHFSRYSGAKID